MRTSKTSSSPGTRFTLLRRHWYVLSRFSANLAASGKWFQVTQ